MHMEKKKLWIFGDSYADPGYKVNNAHARSWPTLLANVHDVTNFAKCGTGPDWSIKRLLDAMETADDLDNISVVFLVSNPYRLNLGFLEDRDQSCLPYMAFGYEGSDAHVNAVMMRYQRHHAFIKNLFNCYVEHSDYSRSEPLKIIGSLQILSQRFEKLLAWPIFDQPLVQPRSDQRFFYVPTPLFDIEGDGDQMDGSDMRMNHLSDENHLVMASSMTKWVENGKMIDTGSFIRG